MDSKDMLPSTMMNRSWKLLLKKNWKKWKIPYSFIENDCCCNGTKDFARTYCNATKIQGFWYHENILTQCLCSKQRNFSTPKAIDKSATILRER